MPVDKAVLQQLIDEIPFAKAEDKTYFTNALLADESAATQFVGQRLRHADYSTKTAALTTKEKDLATRANESVRTYAQQLNEAQTKLRDVMSQLETEQISSTRARALLNKVKTVYNLSDDDIPKIDDAGTVKKGTEGLLDRATVQEMLREHETKIMNHLAPINSFPRIPVIINEIQYEHEKLTGQRLGEAQILELMNMAQQENGPSLRGAWEDKYKIPDARLAKRDETRDKENRQKWEDERKKEASDAALRGVQRGSDGKFNSLSPVMGRKYGEHVDSTNKDITDGRAADAAARNSGPKPTGAERAAANFIARREAGIPMGAEAPVGQK